MTNTGPAATHVARWRVIVSWLLVVVGLLLVVVSLLANFVKRQALDSGSFKSTSQALIADPKIQSAVAATLVDQLYSNVNVSQELDQKLPKILQPLAGPIAGGARDLIQNGAETLLQRPKAQAVFVGAAVAAQQQLVALLENKNKALQTGHGDIVLNLQPLLLALGDRFQLLGKLAGQIPADAAQVTIMHSNNLDTAQKVTQALKVVADWIWALAILAWAVAVWIVPGRRRKIVRAIAAGLAIAGLAVVVIRSLASNYIANHLVASDTVRPAVKDALSIITHSLASAGWTVVGVGVVGLLGTWLAGESRRARDARRTIAPFLASAGTAYAGLVVAFLLFIWWSPLVGPRNILILGVLAIIGFEVLRRQTAREFPNAGDDQAEAEAPAA
jgi:hypothetical protein